MQLKTIPVSKIIPDPDNTKIFAVNDIEHLAGIIEEEGFTSPIEVYELGNGKYQISAGHRRFEAMKYLKSKDIPCIISPAGIDEKTKKLRLLSSNTATRKISPLEMAHSVAFYKQMLKEDKNAKFFREKAARFFNISESMVYRYECILKLIPELQDLCKNPTFPYAALRDAITLSKEEQKELYDKLMYLNNNDMDVPSDESSREEITLTRPRIELIINEIRRAHGHEKSAKTKVTETKELIKPEQEDEEFDLNEFLIDDDQDTTDEIIRIEEDKPQEAGNVYEKGLDECISIINVYKKRRIAQKDKAGIKKRIKELRRALDELENVIN